MRELGSLFQPGQQQESIDQALQAGPFSQHDVSKFDHRHALGVKTGDLRMLMDGGQR